MKEYIITENYYDGRCIEYQISAKREIPHARLSEIIIEKLRSHRCGIEKSKQAKSISIRYALAPKTSSIMMFDADNFLQAYLFK